MRNMAIGILLVILASILIEPLAELANVFRERLTVSTAVNNAVRAAKDRSLEYELLRGLDAKIDESRFKAYFEIAFEDAMNMTRTGSDGDAMIFRSDDGKYNDFRVALAFDAKEDLASGQTVTEVDVTVESDYKFKTKYLKLAEDANKDAGFKLIAERSFVVSVKN
ncbi:hypothetical protein ACFFSY_00630 [Paenibacillus aurantiacus]|uniref:Uncharacterized protein n=1 Tax=Paenibacillus aurantiacus TaxID=1936118 RepID=A0ABV5KGU5_9BACL